MPGMLEQMQQSMERLQALLEKQSLDTGYLLKLAAQAAAASGKRKRKRLLKYTEHR